MFELRSIVIVGTIVSLAMVSVIPLHWMTSYREREREEFRRTRAMQQHTIIPEAILR